MRRDGNRPVFWCQVLGATLLIFPPGLGGDKDNPVTTKPSIVHFGISWSVVEGDVNRDDAMAAAKVWATTLGTAKGMWEQADIRLFDNRTDLLTSVNKGETDFVGMTTREYFELERTLKAEPLFTYMQAGRIDVEYVILVHSNSGINSLGDLQGKRAVLLSKGGRNSLAPLWCDVTLAENGFPDMQHFFRETREVAKASQAVLSVFFRQNDAAIVPRSMFETAASLNPQVGRQLRVLAASPPFVHSVVCMRSAFPVDIKNKYLDIATKLHETPGLLQALTMFKTERILRWEARYLYNVRDLLRKNRLFAQRDSLETQKRIPERSEK